MARVFHLSHVDLDGYACQYIVSKFFDDVTFYNANYGDEIMSRIHSIFGDIDSVKPMNDALFRALGSADSADVSEEFVVMITDLNITLGECRFLNQKISELRDNGINASVVLLDHHITGEECAKAFPWYHLDVNRCSTKMTYDYLLKNFKLRDGEDSKRLECLVEMVNSVDIWLEDGFGFEFGKVAMSMISGSDELNRYMFDLHHRDYKFQLLDSTMDYLRPYDTKPGGLINGLAFNEVGFDNDLYSIKKASLGGDKHTETMDNIVSRRQVELLSRLKDDCSVYYGDKLGFLSYSMGGISVLANSFLKNNEEFDFFININARGNVSLRSNGKCDVSLLSRRCFNGGGHRNASGGRLNGFRGSYVYGDVRSQMQEALDRVSRAFVKDVACH